MSRVVDSKSHGASRQCNQIELPRHANLKDRFVAVVWDHLDDLSFQTLSSHSF